MSNKLHQCARPRNSVCRTNNFYRLAATATKITSINHTTYFCFTSTVASQGTETLCQSPLLTITRQKAPKTCVAATVFPILPNFSANYLSCILDGQIRLLHPQVLDPNRVCQLYSGAHPPILRQVFEERSRTLVVLVHHSLQVDSGEFSIAHYDLAINDT